MSETRNLKLEAACTVDAGKFARGYAWGGLRRFHPDALLNLRDDAQQFCHCVAAEVLAAGITCMAEVKRYTGQRLREFLRDYGYGFVASDLGFTHEAATVSLDGMAANYAHMGGEANPADLADRMMVSRGFRRSRPPRPGAISQKAVLCGIGRRLRHFRRRAGVTMQALSGETGVSMTTICRIETCVGPPRIPSLFTVSHALAVSVDSLLSNEEHAPVIAEFAAYRERVAERIERTLRLSAAAPSVLLREHGLPPNCISLVRGGRTLEMPVLIRLCQALEVWPSYLLKETR